MTQTLQRVTTPEFEAFIALEQNADRRFELIDGEIVEKPMPSQEHAWIESEISFVLKLWLQGNGSVAADVYVESRHRPTDDTKNDRIPDVALVMGRRKITRRGAANFIPEMCIEIQSPDDRLTTMRKKAAFYLEYGAQYALIVRPIKRMIEVYSADDELALLTAADILTFPDLLPGFSVAVDKLFPPADRIEDES